MTSSTSTSDTWTHRGSPLFYFDVGLARDSLFWTRIHLAAARKLALSPRGDNERPSDTACPRRSGPDKKITKRVPKAATRRVVACDSAEDGQKGKERERERERERNLHYSCFRRLAERISLSLSFFFFLQTYA